MTIPASGPRTARVVIVGEAPGADEVRLGEPFVGSSGYELTRMLHEAGIIRSECFITNVANERPSGNDISLWIADSRADAQRKGFTDEHFGKHISPEVRQGIDRLTADLAEIRPNLVIALGNTPLWALTGHDGITDWRGSILECKLVEGFKVLPTYHPAAILRMYDWRAIAIHDLKRAVAESEFAEIQYPPYNFEPSPSLERILEQLHKLTELVEQGPNPVPLSIDFETIRHEIACVGIAWSRHDALCIPIRTSREYWTVDEEIAIVQALRRLLTHPNVRCIFQNGLYDMQYFIRKWGFWPNYVDDTMLAHHVAFAGMPKDLSFLSSMYCEFHQHWKEDLKDWRKAPDDDLKFFTYNCKDCVITFEVMETLRGVLASLRLDSVYAFQMQLCHDVLDIMLRGVAVDLTRRSNLATELMSAAEKRAEFVRSVVGYDLNPKSPKQMQAFLYDEMGCREVRNRKTGRTTANFEALQDVAAKNPILLPVADALLDLRSIGVFLSTFVQAPLDVDKRLRCSYNPAGTETFRFSSSENAFGNGLNLQNIPKGDRQKGPYELPNIRDIFIPDAGFTFFDIDLSSADAQVVAAEANDPTMKQLFREGIKIASFVAKEVYGSKAGNGKAEPWYSRAKAGGHLTNYGGKSRTLSATMGISVHEADYFQSRYFGMFPGIKDWHVRTEAQLRGRRFVTNRFGYRRFYFGRVDGLLPQALAWIPQSTVACVINRALSAVHRTLPHRDVNVLLQVHDSIAGQYRTSRETELLPQIHHLCLIPIPYPDPLTIPVGLKTSPTSWGACSDRDWGDESAKAKVQELV